MGVSLGAQNLDGRHLWESHGKTTVDGGFSVAMFDDGRLNDVQLVRHAFIVVDDVYSLVKKTIRRKARNDTMQNLNQLATSRGETERCGPFGIQFAGPRTSTLVPSDSSGGFSQKPGNPVPSSDIPRKYPQFKGHGACALRSARSCRGTMFFLHLSQTWTPESDNVPSAPQIYIVKHSDPKKQLTAATAKRVGNMSFLRQPSVSFWECPCFSTFQCWALKPPSISRLEIVGGFDP